MIKSMTGFGKANVNAFSKSITIEIRSLNSKQLDLNTRIPMLFRDRENEIRTILTQELERGKIDLAIYIDKIDKPVIAIDENLAKAYFDELRKLSDSLGNRVESDIFAQMLKMPDVVTTPKEELSEELWEMVKKEMLNACSNVNKFRSDEGRNLAADFEKRVELIHNSIDTITPFEKNRIETLRDKFHKSLSELSLNGQYDPNRLEQEIIFFIEKLDITEEKVRLRKHCSYFMETMNEVAAPGKKLGFIAQEMGREINTIGSKCNDFNIQQVVVQMKDELEKIKEQLANVL